MPSLLFEKEKFMELIPTNLKKTSEYLMYAVFFCAFLCPILYIIRLPLSSITGLPLQSPPFIPIAALAGIGLLINYKLIIKNTRIFWPLFVWIGYAAITTLWSPDKLRGAMFIGVILCGFCAVGVFAEPALKKKAEQGFLSGVTVMNLFMVMLYVQNSDIVDIVYTRFAYFVSQLDVNPNMWGFFQILAIIIIFSWIIETKADFQTHMLLGYNIWMLWLTNSRGAILPFFAVLAASVFLMNVSTDAGSRIKTVIIKRLKLLAASSFFFITLILTTVMLIIIPYGTTYSGSFFGASRIMTVETLTDDNGREVIWRSMFARFFKSPTTVAFGAGNGGADVFTGQALSEYVAIYRGEVAAASPHSMYFLFLIEHGIIGFLLFCAFSVNIIITLLKRNRSMLIFLIPTIVSGLVVSVNTSPPFILTLAIVLAYICVEEEALEGWYTY